MYNEWETCYVEFWNSQMSVTNSTLPLETITNTDYKQSTTFRKYIYIYIGEAGVMYTWIISMKSTENVRRTFARRCRACVNVIQRTTITNWARVARGDNVSGLFRPRESKRYFRLRLRAGGFPAATPPTCRRLWFYFPIRERIRVNRRTLRTMRRVCIRK